MTKALALLSIVNASLRMGVSVQVPGHCHWELAGKFLWPVLGQQEGSGVGGGPELGEL